MAKTAANIQLGLGDLTLKAYSAGAYASGFTDAGFHSDKGMTFAYKGEEKKVKTGNQLGIVKTFFVGEEASLEGALLEFTALNIARSLGLADGGVTDDAVNHVKSFYVGGNTTSNYFSAMFTTVFENSLWAKLTIFKGLFGRDMKLELKPDPIDIPVKIDAQVDDDVGATNGKLAQIQWKYA